MKSAGALVFALACTSSTTASSDNQPVLTGDVCAIYTSAATCADDAACMWLGSDCAGSDTTAPTCSCGNGAVCVAENGQPLACMTPEPGTGDPCTRIEGLTCAASSTIAGLCICD